MGEFADYCGTELVRYLAQVKFDQLAYFKDLGEATYNQWIEETLIPQAEKLVDGRVNHSFGTPGLGTMELDGSGKSILFIPPKYSPLVGITTATINGTAISASDFVCYPQYIRYDGGNFPTGKKNVVMLGSFGYLNAASQWIVPQDVEYVTAQLCANIILDMVRRNLAPDLFASFMAGGGKQFQSLFAMPNIFQKALKDLLKPYRINWVDIG